MSTSTSLLCRVEMTFPLEKIFQGLEHDRRNGNIYTTCGKFVGKNVKGKIIWDKSKKK